jgi:dual specificity tyrosine-phosphorylation-regulated kinase 2/3/4
MDKHVSSSSIQSVTKLPTQVEEEKESPKNNMWRSVSRGTGKLIRRASVNDRKGLPSPKKKEDDAVLMPAPTSVPKRNMFGLTKKTSMTPSKDLSDRNTSLTGLPMTRRSSSNTITPPPPRYDSSTSNPSTDDELSGGNSREMELIVRSASTKYRTKIERDLEELETIRRRHLKDLGNSGTKDPVPPASAVKIWGRGMSTFERGEVVDYPNVWFCSDATIPKSGRGDPHPPSASKISDKTTSVGVANFGFDDDIGNYVVVSGDHLAYRYEILGMLGKGSFGQVCKCLDHKTGKVVAVKIIRNKQRFHTQALVEVNILQKLCQWVYSGRRGLTVGCG